MTPLQQSIRNFDKRWKIPYDAHAEFERFKRRVLLSFDEHLGDMLSNTWLGIEYIRLLGLPPAPSDLEHHARYETKARKDGGYKAEFPIPFAIQRVQFHSTEIWDYISNVRDLRELIRCVQCVFWLWHFFDADSVKSLEGMVAPFFKSIKDSIEISQVPVQVNGSSANLRDIVFYPKGARLLDEKLVNDCIDWLDGYSKKAKQYFTGALDDFCNKHYRDSIDKMRVSLETFMRRFLNTRKSLENQKSLLGKYLENKNVPSDMKKAYSVIFYQYTEYQNNVAKHPSRNTLEPTEAETEFIIYQTGLMMRFLIQLDSRQTMNS